MNSYAEELNRLPSVSHRLLVGSAASALAAVEVFVPTAKRAVQIGDDRWKAMASQIRRSRLCANSFSRKR